MRRLAVSIGKLNSQRCPYKLLRPLGQTTVLEHHLQMLLKVDVDAHWFLTRDEPLINIAKRSGIIIGGRTADTTISTTFYGLWGDIAKRAKELNFDVIVWLNACCPFINLDRIHKLTRTAPDRIIVPVYPIERPYWSATGEPIYTREELNTQSSPKMLALSHSFWVRTPDWILNTACEGAYGNQHRTARLEQITPIEALDIDDEYSYQIVNGLFTSLFH